MPTEFNEARVAEKAQEIFNYACLSCDDLTEKAFEKAKDSFRDFMRNVCDRDRYKLRIIRQVLDSVDSNHDNVAWCDRDTSVKIANVAVYQWMKDDLNLYPENAEKKIGRDRVNGRLTNWGVDEMTVRDMLYFAKAHTEGVDISRATMPKVYQALAEHFNLSGEMSEKVFVSKVLAQVWFGQPLHYRKIRGWDEHRAGGKAVEMGYVTLGEDGFVRVAAALQEKVR